MSTKTKYVIGATIAIICVVAAIVLAVIGSRRTPGTQQVAVINAPEQSKVATETPKPTPQPTEQEPAEPADKKTQEALVAVLDASTTTGGKVTTTVKDVPLPSGSLPAELINAPARITEAVKALTSLPLSQEMTPAYEAALVKYWYGRGTQAQAVYALGAGGRLTVSPADIYFYQSADKSVSPHVYVVAFTLRDSTGKPKLLVQGWYDASVGMIKLTKAVPDPGI